MLNNYSKMFITLVTIIMCLMFNSVSFAQEKNEEKIQKINKYIQNNYPKLKTPGMSVGIILEGKEYYLNYGYSNKENNVDITTQTNFEIGSLTKAFTALAVTKLEKEGKLSINDKISKFYPQFALKYKGTNYDITVEQLMHHTSGIGTHTISLLREDSSSEALNNLVETLSGIELSSVPGSRFEYATVNYGLLGAIIEKVSGEKYENYIEEKIFSSIGMNNSYVGFNSKDKNRSEGYKISYFKSRVYDAPVFRNNYSAGYVVSNTNDMVKWLQFQLGNTYFGLGSYLNEIHEPDKSVEPKNNTFYSRGWFNVLNKHDEVMHGGENPNFSTYISFSKKYNSGVVILSNSNAENFPEFSENIKDYLYGENLKDIKKGASKFDTIFSVVLIVSMFISVLITAFIGYLIFSILKKRRHFFFDKKYFKKIFIYMISSVLILYGIYLLPEALAGVDWYTVMVWRSSSFIASVLSIVVLIGLSVIAYIILLLFPGKNRYLKEVPEVIVLSLLSGISNSVIIFLITNSLNEQTNLKYTLYYFFIVFYIYISGRRALEIKLAYLTQLAIKAVRETIINRLLRANYEEFEKLESGKLMATTTTDINQISGLAGLLVVVVTSVITILAAFCYLAVISAYGTLTILGVIVVVATIYGYYGFRAKKYFEVARETQNVFMSKIEALINGYKDLSLHRHKKEQYRDEFYGLNKSFMNNNMKAFKMFVNAFMLGESLFIIVLATIAFGFILLFHTVSNQELTTFILILLYILGPINGILNSLPKLMQIKVAINKVNKLLQQLPKLDDDNIKVKNNDITIRDFSVHNISYEYEGTDHLRGFSIDSINFHVEKGEILFIIGGNGSGKSTLLKLITGLYKPKDGCIRVNGETIPPSEISEFISAVFTDSYLFERLYNCELTGKEDLIQGYLNSLMLDEKVTITKDQFSTTSLSTGQKKRLHLLRCYLENKEILIFDEIAADQDPNFRSYFYRTLLPQMKGMGKIVIAVTHDDHYFDAADRVLKLDMGRMENVSERYFEENK